MDRSEASFLEHVHMHRRIIHRLAGLYALDTDERKDLEQETILQAWRSWPHFRGDAKFSTWLYRIALNTVLTWKRRPAIVQRASTGRTPDLADHGQQRRTDEQERLHAAMRRLPEADRALLALHLDGFDHAEAGEVLGLTANHVGVKMHRIKARLTELLKPE
jgi:RNA polymerase sigma-70 factor (ECF subfamily)